jgi:hypothetical protein
MPGISMEAIDEPGSIFEARKFPGAKTWLQSLDIRSGFGEVGAVFVRTVRKPSATDDD